MDWNFLKGVKAACFGAAIVAATAVTANAASVTVIADVNAPANASSNSDLYDGVLGAGTNVLFSRTDAQQSGTSSYYNSLSGVTASESGAGLDTGILSGVDLLVITSFYNTAVNYSASELSALGSFVSGGGNLLLVLEAGGGSPLFAGYNSILSAVGSSIRYTGGRTATSFTDTSLADTDISDSSENFRVLAYAHLSGGEAVAQDNSGNTFVAYENLADQMPAVPLPGSLPLMAFGAVALAGVARKRRRN